MSKLAKALSASAGNAGGDKLYVEDVFSTYLYTGTGNSSYNSGDGSNQNIVSGIDLSGEGGMVWTKMRNDGVRHSVVDTARGATKMLNTDEIYAEVTTTDSTISFNSNGHTLGVDNGFQRVNFKGTVPYNFASWSFRKAPKFFDVVTYTGNATSGRTIAHSLGSTPGMMIVKQTSGDYNWQIYHSGFGATKFLEFNNSATQTSTAIWNDTAPTDSVFTVGNEYGVNRSGYTYVAYLFASDAGGYGDDGTESIIKCGSYTTDSSGNASVTLGFEPQWVLNKTSSYSAAWSTVDMMRGFDTLQSNGYNQAPVLSPNTSNAEFLTGGKPRINATGFTVTGTTASQTFIYMAIRRPMKTPESGTEVFAPVGATTTAPLWKSSFPVDMGWYRYIIGTSAGTYLGSRLTGTGRLESSNAAAEATDGTFTWDYMNGWFENSFNDTNYVGYNFKRATGFMDVVAYTGDGASARAVQHSLGVVPEFYVVKVRDAAYDWQTYSATMGNNYSLRFNQAHGIDVLGTWPYWANTSPTSTAFYVDNAGNASVVNGNNKTYVCYLFATLAGVSKVGGYTGTGAALNVDCGFTGGARFILIKRTDTTGDWFTYDSFRGITAGNDPYLLLNTTAAQVTNTDYIDPLNAGFTVTSSAPAGLNASGGTYIFLAIA